MHVLVTHASRFGSTREIAERIGHRLEVAGLQATVVPADGANPARYDAVILGSGIYAGHWAPAATELVRRHEADLASRPVWLFSSGPIGSNPNYRATEPGDATDAARAIHSRDHRTFWGAWDREKAAAAGMGRMERFAGRHLLPEGDFRDWPAIDAWADGIARELGAH